MESSYSLIREKLDGDNGLILKLYNKGYKDLLDNIEYCFESINTMNISKYDKDTYYDAVNMNYAIDNGNSVIITFGSTLSSRDMHIRFSPNNFDVYYMYGDSCLGKDSYDIFRKYDRGMEREMISECIVGCLNKRGLENSVDIGGHKRSA